MSKIYIYSTLTADQKYVEWVKGGGDVMTEGRSVIIKGGTNVADSRFITPMGVVTGVSDEDYALLQDNSIFKLHVQNGFITVTQSQEDPEVVAADMVTRDGSAPLVDADFAEKAKDAAAIGAATTEVKTNGKKGK